MSMLVKQLIRNNPDKDIFYEDIDGSNIDIFAIKGSIVSHSNYDINNYVTEYAEVVFENSIHVRSVVVFNRLSPYFRVGSEAIFYFASVRDDSSEESCFLVAIDNGNELIVEPDIASIMKSVSNSVSNQKFYVIFAGLMITVIGIPIAFAYLVWIWIIRPIKLKSLYTKAVKRISSRPVTF